MNVIRTRLPGVLVLEPRRFEDERGFFMETWNRQRYAEAGVPETYVQDNISFSKQGVLRGLHYQHPTGQGKLVSVLDGAVFDVVVDIKRGSPTFGQWLGTVLSAENGRQLYVPPGYAHGFVVTEAQALFLYKCTAYYAPEHEHTIRWDDPALGIDWPVAAPIVSAKDAAGLRLADLPEEALPGPTG